MKKVIVALSVLLCILIAVMCTLVITILSGANVGKTPPTSATQSDPTQNTQSVQTQSGPNAEELMEAMEDTDQFNRFQNGGNTIAFELPLVGAMGFVPVKTNVYLNADLSGGSLGSLPAGGAFCILADGGNTWKVKGQSGIEGYIDNRICFINLPDIIPSIVYDIVNSEASIFMSSGKVLPDVTGEKLMDYYHYNARYGTEQYVAPVLFPMAVKIYQAQQAALSDGNTLVIYETFRPYDVQMLVADRLKTMSNSDPVVQKGLTKGSWSLGWFIATGLSTHQKGCAIDVSLAQIDSFEIKNCGKYQYISVTDYREYEMQCRMHELSTQAVSLARPVSNARDSWIGVANNKLMTEGAITLKHYCTQVGMTPLASEWWHFNDWEAVDELGSNYKMKYDFGLCISKPADFVEG